jgi:hypothetical protein
METQENTQHDDIRALALIGAVGFACGLFSIIVIFLVVI